MLTAARSSELRLGYAGRISRRRAAHAVVNPTDRCSLSCPQCLYSAPLQKQAGAPLPAELAPGDAARLGTLLAEAGVRQLVISGGGEPLEAPETVTALITAADSVEELVIITSAHYATDRERAAAALDPVLEAFTASPAAQRLIIRLSADAGHRVDPACYRHAAEWAAARHGGRAEVRVIIRAAASDLQAGRAPRWLAELGADPDRTGDTAALPVIDGMPAAWLRPAGTATEIPVIFKPDYGLGLARHTTAPAPASGWRYLAACEERAGTPFNLSWRGPRGEGHNYYGTLLAGEEHCRELAAGRRDYIAPKDDTAKGLALYATARGRLYVNAGPPDTWLPVSRLPSWHGILSLLDHDALACLALNNPTGVLLALASEASPGIPGRADTDNFVFSPARLSMETARLRAWLAQAADAGGLLAPAAERRSLWKHLAGLDETPHPRHSDPVTGNCETIHDL